MLLPVFAQNKLALQKQYTATEEKIAERVAELIKQNETLKRQQTSIKKRLLHFNKMLSSHRSIKALSSLQGDAYLEAYNKKKYELIRTDEKIKQEYETITDLQDQFSFSLNQDKVIKDLRLKLKIISAQINK